jgi:DNA invertase Pin-like site-specific DNA recombinase
MSNIGYIRVSKDGQDVENQRHAILEYAHQQKIQINEFIQIEMGSGKSQFDRQITALLDRLKKGDKVFVTELSRLARNMLESLNLIEAINVRMSADLIFILQPELSTNSPHVKLLQAIHGYHAEAERNFISMRTKMALAKKKAAGIKLGRPKGAKNKKVSVLHPYKHEIENLIGQKVSLMSIKKIIDDNFDKPPSYNTYKNYVKSHISNQKEFNRQLFTG